MFKQPITDPGKKSKKGRLTLEEQDGVLVTIQEGKGDPKKVSLLKFLVFRMVYSDKETNLTVLRLITLRNQAKLQYGGLLYAKVSLLERKSLDSECNNKLLFAGYYGDCV